MGKGLGLLLIYLGFFVAVYADDLLYTFVNLSTSALQVVGTIIFIGGSFVLMKNDPIRA